MAQVTVEIPDELADEIARRAAALGTTPEAWIAAVAEDVAADLPEDPHEAGPDDFICR